MSTGLINNDAINDALQRAKELAAAPANLKRAITDDSNLYPAKRPNMDGPSIISTLGGQLGGLGGMPQYGGMGTVPNSETVVEVITVPGNTVGLVIGKGGEQISSIQSSSGARVQMSPENENNGVRQCTLQGSKSSVERAKQLIHEVISRAGQRNRGDMPMGMGHMGGMGGGGGHDVVTFEIMIPGTKCGLIIGKQGETIKNLQEQSGVKMVMIQETQEATGAPKPLRMTGDADKIEHAKRLVYEILNSRDDSGGGGSRYDGGMGMGGGIGSAKGEVVVPRASVGMIIGRSGETIKRLAMETGTKIQFKPDSDPTTPDRCAVIMGSREQIYKATELITELVQKSCQGGGQGGPQETFYMHVPANKTGLVIGKGGETIKQICNDSGAHVELSREPPPNGTEKVFIIKGTPYQIHHSQHIIRIKVGDIPPGTPVPPFGGMGGAAAQMANQFHGGAPPHFNGGQFQGMQANQWNPSFGAADPSQGNGWAASAAVQQQQQQAAFYQQQQQAQQQAHAPQAYGSMQPQYAAAAQYNPAAVAQPQAVAAQPQAAAAATTASPAINPQTGQPDYSAQWAEYYRSMGMHNEAAKIDQQMKASSVVQQPNPGAAAQYAVAAGGGAPGAAQFGGAPAQQQYSYAAASAQAAGQHFGGQFMG